jgi:hypothetical protein
MPEGAVSPRGCPRLPRLSLFFAHDFAHLIDNLLRDCLQFVDGLGMGGDLGQYLLLCLGPYGALTVETRVPTMYGFCLEPPPWL